MSTFAHSNYTLSHSHTHTHKFRNVVNIDSLLHLALSVRDLPVPLFYFKNKFKQTNEKRRERERGSDGHDECAGSVRKNQKRLTIKTSVNIILCTLHYSLLAMTNHCYRVFFFIYFLLLLFGRGTDSLEDSSSRNTVYVFIV
jgi:hypothetical protein